MMAYFYSNENFPHEEVLTFAFQYDRILLTLNRKHFIRLHKKGAKHTGIFACTYDPNFKALARRIHESVQKESNLTGRLIRINRPQKSAH